MYKELYVPSGPSDQSRGVFSPTVHGHENRKVFTFLLKRKKIVEQAVSVVKRKFYNCGFLERKFIFSSNGKVKS